MPKIKALTDGDGNKIYPVTITDAIYDNYGTNGEGSTGNGMKLSDLLLYKYEKPYTGIPKYHLASDVQTSLGKADTALQSHQDISGKADKSATVSTVTYNTTSKKITKTINGTTTDVVTAATIVTDGGGITQHQDISGKADKIPEVNHGTSDTTFTLTPNVMHIWGTVTTLTLSLPTDSNSYLDEFLITFTSGSTPTTLSLPATVKWVQDMSIEANKTYQISIVNNLAGWLTNGMPSGGGSGGGGENNVIETVKVNGTALTPDANKAVDVTVPTETTVTSWGFTKNAGTITGITMNGSSKGTSGVVNLGTVITSETSLSKGTTTGSGNAVTDLSVSGHTITLTKGTTFLTSSDTVTIYSGSTAPSSSTGSDGDIYIQTS